MTTQELIAAKAALLWLGFTKNQKTMVRFGIFPAEPTQAAEKLLKAHAQATGNVAAERDVVRLLAVALMDCAKKDGGMRA